MNFLLYLRLFLIFLKVGVIGFGGGYGMLPLIEREIVGRGFLTKREFWDMVAIAQTTPGPIAVNVATFVGYRMGGVLGSALCTFGVVLPAFIVILIIAIGAKRFLYLKEVQWILIGIKSAIIGLMLLASYSLYNAIPAPKKWVVLMAAGSFLLLIFKTNPFLVILIFAVIGFILGKIGLFT